MAVSNITYSNKVALNENSSVADINKGRAEDWNEIKAVVNNNATETSKNSTNIANITGTILWTNPNPTSSFTSQTVTLSSDDYDMLEIIYISESTGTLNRLLKTVKSLKGYNTILEITNPLGSTTPIRTRNVTYVSNTSLTFSDGYAGNVYPLSTDNSKCIPLYIIGYKTGLFD
jgi:hypothetical protein